MSQVFKITAEGFMGGLQGIGGSSIAGHTPGPVRFVKRVFYVTAESISEAEEMFNNRDPDQKIIRNVTDLGIKSIKAVNAVILYPSDKDQ